MNWDAIGAIGELVSAVAVLATLVYLAIQVRHSRTLLERNETTARAQTRQRMVEQAQAETYKGMIEDPSIFQCFLKTKPLTESEWIKLNGWLLSAMRQREYEWFQMKSGVIEEEVWEAYRQVIRIHLGTARTLDWWESIGCLPFDAGFNTMVSDLLNEQGGIPFFEAFGKFVAKTDSGNGVVKGSSVGA